ncbi:MAG: TIGR02680 family protein [Clostridia bacterium]|jgi:uncharacterized protein (TIGR02680 family)
MNKQNSWVLNRAGILDYWYYDEEYFDFADGRMLIRGQNGAGKSVTMQSFIPLLLDGKRNPERLDPFNSKARKLEDYLLGEYEVNGKEAGTGYLFLEFKRRHEEVYVSIGMGMRARKGQGIGGIWYFILTDGRRIGIDFFLYEKVLDGKVALTRRKLENLIGDGGMVLDRQEQYAAEVNKLLFGYDSLEEFEEMVDLIVKIRTPKLSRDLRPSRVYDIMQDSLPRLSEDDLRQLSESIENLDAIQTRLGSMKDSYASAESLRREYDRYNKYMLYEKVKGYLRTKEQLERERKAMEKLERDIAEKTREWERLSQQIEELRSEERRLRIRQEELREREEYKTAEKLARLKEEAARLQETIHGREEARRRKNDQLTNLLRDRKEKQDCLYRREKEIKEELEEAFSLCEDLFLESHWEMLKNLNWNETANLKLLKEEAKAFHGKVEKIWEKLNRSEAKKREFADKEREVDEKEKERKHLHTLMEQTELVIEDSKNRLKERISAYHRGNHCLNLEKEEEVGIFQEINRIRGKGGRHLVLNRLLPIYQRHLSRFTREKGKLSSEIEEWEKRIRGWEEEIAGLKSQEERLYPTEELRVLARERLQALGIPHVPFYLAVEFRDTVKEEVRDIIEQGLLDMGILDSLIVPARYREILRNLTSDVKESILFPNPKFMVQTLDMMVMPGKTLPEGIAQQDVADVLASIGLNHEKGGVFLNEEGLYGIGILQGRTTSAYKARYIGMEARKRYREEQIRKLLESIEQAREAVTAKEAEIAEIVEKEKQLQEEYDRFPDFEDLDAAYELLDEYEVWLGRLTKELEELKEKREAIYRELLTLKEEVSRLAIDMKLNLTLEVFRTAREDAQAYRDVLQELEQLLHLYRNDNTLLQVTEERIQETQEDLDDILYELGKDLRQMDGYRKAIEEMENVLKERDVEEIKGEIERCIRRLEQIPEELEDLGRRKEDAAAQRSRSEALREERREQVQELGSQLKTALNRLKEELSFGFIPGYPQTEEELDAFVLEQCRELDSLFKGNDNQRDEMNHRMEVEMNRHQAALLEYSPNIEFKEYRYGNSRLLITFKLEGSYHSLYRLLEILKGNIQECELLIQQEERRLFEDILANSIGSKISAKIRKARKWIDNMNRIMKGMDTSSGLEFQLRWHAQGAQDDDELHTNELVNLLEMDPKAIKDSDRRKITNHFKTRIDRARRYRDDGQDYSALHMIMREILDYRQWFEFKLYYQKTGESRRELSNNAYDKFSGGEKALSIYVPLLAALYAKYDSAREDAPKVIAMDEAFAGVDENNIENMFGLIQSLGFNFIMNSQSLWGDYRTVPSLVIYELLREKNSSTVLKVKYFWTGKERRMVGIA